MTFELRTASSEASVVKVVREILRSIDRDLPAVIAVPAIGVGSYRASPSMIVC
jgi:hypothetical protein